MYPLNRPPADRRRPQKSNAGAEPVLSGTPLGRAFRIRQSPFNDDLVAAIRACSVVHGDGPLPSIPIDYGSLRGTRGRFGYDQDGRPTSIVIVPAIPHRAFALVHEIGHFLDLAGIGDLTSFASATSAELDPWRAAVEQSRRAGDLSRVIDALVRTSPDHEAQAYQDFRDLPEYWARSYAQYITLRSGDPRLLAGLAEHRNDRSARAGGISRLLHWDDDDFAPIADAIERLFRRLGWRSGP